MKLSDLLMDDWIAVPLEAGDLTEAIRALVDLLVHSGSVGMEEAEKLVQGLAASSRSELLRVNDEIVLVVGRCPSVDDVSVLLGIGRQPFVVTPDSTRGPATARALVLLLTPHRLDVFKERFAPTLARALKEEGRTQRLLAAGSPMEIRAFKELMAVELQERLLVEDALTPLKYRIYPDTPLSEVVDLMVRRGLRAVPVVGEHYEVLGVLTVGDALKHLIPRVRGGEETKRASSRELTARDVMTRTVMCVSEDQSLIEAANLMLNRDVDQLPVVREGELIGFLTRDSILRVLFGRDEPSSAEA
jgi:CBS domain-containing protein